MFCPTINALCKYIDCPKYMEVDDGIIIRDYCLESLFMRKTLGVLTLQEKRDISAVAQEQQREQMAGSLDKRL